MSKHALLVNMLSMRICSLRKRLTMSVHTPILGQVRNLESKFRVPISESRAPTSEISNLGVRGGLPSKQQRQTSRRGLPSPPIALVCRSPTRAAPAPAGTSRKKEAPRMARGARSHPPDTCERDPVCARRPMVPVGRHRAP